MSLAPAAMFAGDPPALREAGYTVWRLKVGRGRGRPARRFRWFLAHSGPELPAARAVFDRLRELDRGAVQLRDPAGRELGFHVGRWPGV